MQGMDVGFCNGPPASEGLLGSYSSLLLAADADFIVWICELPSHDGGV
jgi:hypothetical protein